MSRKYFVEGSAIASPITPPQSPGPLASPSLSPDIIAKVNDWVSAQPAPFSSETTRQTNNEKNAIIQESSPGVSSEQKKVHWTPNIQDNEGKTIRKLQPRQSRPDNKTIVLSSKTPRRTRQPSVP